jgi:transcriptional regulator with XRE-family HTH domain
MSLGKYIQAVRHRRGISQWELSRLSGLTRSHISRLELDAFENPKVDTFLLLAKALKVHPNELYQAAGYIEEGGKFRKGPPKTLDEAVAGVEIQFVNIPVTDDVKQLANGVSDLEQYASWGFSDGSGRDIKGVVGHGVSLYPEIREGDIIFVCPDILPVPGNVVLCYRCGKLALTRYPCESTLAGQIYGIVVGINRKFI